MQIILYKTDICPKCKVLIKKLENKEITFSQVTNTDELEKLNIEEVPVLSVDGNLMDFKTANDWINNL